MPRPKTKTDLEREAGLDPVELPKDNKKGAENRALTNKLATARLKRLNTQNSKLSIELRKLKGQVGDIAQHRREVLQANSTVKQQVLAVPFRISLQVAKCSDPAECARIMEAALVECLSDLAYERTEAEKEK